MSKAYVFLWANPEVWLLTKQTTHFKGSFGRDGWNLKSPLPLGLSAMRAMTGMSIGWSVEFWASVSTLGASTSAISAFTCASSSGLSRWMSTTSLIHPFEQNPSCGVKHLALAKPLTSQVSLSLNTSVWPAWCYHPGNMFHKGKEAYFEFCWEFDTSCGE